MQSIPGVEPVMFGALTKRCLLIRQSGLSRYAQINRLITRLNCANFDTSADFNGETLETEHKLNRLRFENFTLTNGKQWLESQRSAWEQVAAEREQAIVELSAVAAEREQAIVELSSRLQAAAERLASINAILNKLHIHWVVRFVKFLFKTK